ncbi:MAG: mechanosensitive ion channel family protein [Acidobacteriales bacterium]|nr:mechanosensitive ion channel family protein [Terriglobales bacterium]
MLIFGVCVGVGLLLDSVGLAVLRRLAKRTTWPGDDVIVDSLRRFPLVWMTLLGGRLALERSDLPPQFEKISTVWLPVLGIFAVTIFVARAAGGLVGLYSGKAEGLLPATSIFRNLARIVIYLLGFTMMLQAMGIAVTPLLTAFGVGGLAVALALQDTFGNLFAGLHILASRQVQPGDYIKLSSGEEGYVEDIRWRNTTIRALQNNMFIIPNSKLAGSIITNFDQPDPQLLFGVELGVAYDSDLEKVERVTVEVARAVLQSVPGGVKDFEPNVRYHTFGPSSINFTVTLRAHLFADQFRLKHEFVKRLQKRYQAEGIEIPLPSRTVIVKPESTAEIKPAREE